ncbi:coiled-coil domain-containing protein 62 isoform 3-T3 [Leptosomus discolor]
MPGSAPVPPSPRSSSLLHSASPQKLSPSLGNSTIQQQRQELQLLFAELRDCEKEHNDRVAVHQGQRLAWEDDRQKVLTLGERYNLLNDELNKRNEIIKSLVLTQQVFKEMSRKVTYKTLYCQALEEKNQSLLYSVLELSAKTGQLQVREQELLTMLKLKDEVILETTDDITEFKLKFKELESALREAKMEELSLNKANQDLQLRLKELVLETNKLKDDLCEKVKENNNQQEEIIHLKQENDCLRNELALTVEKAKLKDQLLQFAKSKQARTDAELSSLRQIYVKQQRDLQFLHVSLGSSQELRQKHEKAAHERSEENVDLSLFHLHSPCLTSTQKGDRSQRCEEFSDEDFPLESNDLSVTKPTNRCCNATTDQDTVSPTSTLQCALAESRQMVADLELSALLHASPRCSPHSIHVNTKFPTEN